VVGTGAGSRARSLAVLALAVVADALLGEPPARWHPVVAMGRLIALAERQAPAPAPLALAYGALLTFGGTIGCWLGTRLALRAVRRFAPRFALLASALLLKSTFAVRALDDAASAVAGSLAAGDPDSARASLRALVSRDAASLDAPLVAAAAVESVAENLSDSFVAPLFWYALLGVPGAMAYRFVNTADAMLGYHGGYEYVGKAAARLDDAVNWLPARISGLLLIAAAWLRGADARAAWRTMWEHHGRTASPNAGWPMSAAAGALNVRLEKLGHYTLGDGPPPATAAISAAVGLARAAAALGTASYLAWALARRPNAAAA
jgi:adenosylcobinamide-phosphate synthase